MDQESKSIAIIGGGLVGSLSACFFAKRGYTVHLYEAREDIRLQEAAAGRSINLALSYRGLEALKAVGLDKQVIDYGIPMRGRLIHKTTGQRYAVPYGTRDQFILSVDRKHLNEILLTAAEQHPNVKIHFFHKLTRCNTATGDMTFQRVDGTEFVANCDYIIGCDGAYSAIRKQLMRNSLLNYSQEYIPHGYMELCMPATNNRFAMEVNYLHIWPRNEFMMIALPNLDKSYTCTLFMPFKSFESIKTENDLMEFFGKYFPDSIPLFGEELIKETFFSSKASPVISIKCHPYHKGRVVVMGDAAHAMVPFYGQGMNCGFEDCILFDEILDECGDDIDAAFAKFSEIRCPDAHAICDLAMYNYIEMRSSVNSSWFLFRKSVDNFLHWLMPKTFVPLYTMVAFTRYRYHHIITKSEYQRKIVNFSLLTGMFALLSGGLFLVFKLDKNFVSKAFINFKNLIADGFLR